MTNGGLTVNWSHRLSIWTYSSLSWHCSMSTAATPLKNSGKWVTPNSIFMISWASAQLRSYWVSSFHDCVNETIHLFFHVLIFIYLFSLRNCHGSEQENPKEKWLRIRSGSYEVSKLWSSNVKKDIIVNKYQ